MSEHPEASKHDDEEEQQQGGGKSIVGIIIGIILVVVILGAVGGGIWYYYTNVHGKEGAAATAELKDLGGFKPESNFTAEEKPKEKKGEDGDEVKSKKKSASLREGLDMKNSQMVVNNKEVPMTV